MTTLAKRSLTVKAGLPLFVLTLAASLAFSGSAEAQEAGGLLSDLAQGLNNAAPGSDAAASLSGRIIQLIALMTVLSIAPGVLVGQDHLVGIHRVSVQLPLL